jgi:hypothetical protein
VSLDEHVDVDRRTIAHGQARRYERILAAIADLLIDLRAKRDGRLWPSVQTRTFLDDRLCIPDDRPIGAGTNAVKTVVAPVRKNVESHKSSEIAGSLSRHWAIDPDLNVSVPLEPCAIPFGPAISPKMTVPVRISYGSRGSSFARSVRKPADDSHFHKWEAPYFCVFYTI